MILMHYLLTNTAFHMLEFSASLYVLSPQTWKLIYIQQDPRVYSFLQNL